MSTPTPRTDAAYAKWQEGWDRTPFGPDFARKLERELTAERETSRLLRVAMDARDEGYTQSRRRMSALESEVTAKGQAVRNLAEVISGQDKELECEREKVRTLREALDEAQSCGGLTGAIFMQARAALAATEGKP